MSNLSILEQNIMLAIEGAAQGDADRCEEAQAIFLRWKDRNLLLSERAAYEWAETLHPFLAGVVTVASTLHSNNIHAVLTPEQTSREVMAFIRERHVRRYFPGH